MRIREVISGAILAAMCVSCATSPDAVFDVTTVADKAVSHVGGTVVVTTTVTNLSDELRIFPAICGNAFVVIGPADGRIELAEEAGGICPAIFMPDTIPAHGHFTVTQTWHETMLSQDSRTLLPDPAGVYTIRGDLNLSSSAHFHTTTVRLIP